MSELWFFLFSLAAGLLLVPFKNVYVLLLVSCLIVVVAPVVARYNGYPAWDTVRLIAEFLVVSQVSFVGLLVLISYVMPDHWGQRIRRQRRRRIRGRAVVNSHGAHLPQSRGAQINVKHVGRREDAGTSGTKTRNARPER